MVDFTYDAFEPVAIYGIQSAENIVVPADAPYDTLDELIAASQENPGQIKFGISTGGGVYIMPALWPTWVARSSTSLMPATAPPV